MAALTMMRVDRISCSRRGRMPGRASGGAYATPFGAMISLSQHSSACHEAAPDCSRCLQSHSHNCVQLLYEEAMLQARCTFLCRLLRTAKDI